MSQESTAWFDFSHHGVFLLLREVVVHPSPEPERYFVVRPAHEKVPEVMRNGFMNKLGFAEEGDGALVGPMTTRTWELLKKVKNIGIINTNIDNIIEVNHVQRSGKIRANGGAPLEEAPPGVLPLPEGRQSAGGRARSGAGEDRGSDRVHDGRPPEISGVHGGERGLPEEGGDRGAGQDGDRGSRAADVRSASAGSRGLNPNHFFLTGEIDRQGGFSPKDRARENLAAIRILKQIQEEARPATPGERSLLARFAGFGGLPDLLVPGTRWRTWGDTAWMSDVHKDLFDNLLAGEEVSSLRTSVNNAHFTSGAVIDAVWETVHVGGFSGGKILESSMGIGNFLGKMPRDLVANSEITGIEKEVLTGQMASMIYPDADIHVKGFEEVFIKPQSMDLVIGNVPFGKFSVHDPAYNKHKLSIHNYFLIRSLDLLKPGGVLAVITSSYTMNQMSDSARRLMHARGILAGMIRLPDHAQTAQAGTEVTTDILFFVRRRQVLSDFQMDIDKPIWLTSSVIASGEYGKVRNNDWFAGHPEYVLGTEEIKSSQFGHRLGVVSPHSIEKVIQNHGDLFHEIAMEIRILARQETSNWLSSEARNTIPGLPRVAVDADLGMGSHVVIDGIPHRVTGPGEAVVVAMGAKATSRLLGMIEIRDALMEVFRVQAETSDDDIACDAARQALNEAYGKFVKRHGFLNESANRRVFKGDPAFGRLFALEIYDEEKGSAEKSDVFFRNVLRKPEAPEPGSMATPADALLACLGLRGWPIPVLIGDLCGMDPEHAVKELLRDRLLFEDPATGDLEIRERYLSGNVREKLQIAGNAAEENPGYRANVEALLEVKPVDIDPDLIEMRFGAPWIPGEVIRDFVVNVCGSYPHSAVMYDEVLNLWTVDVSGGMEFSTGRKGFAEILEAALNQESIKIYDTVREAGQDKRVLNADETQLANERIHALREAFAAWLNEREDAKKELARIYNERFNAYVEPRYDGSHLTFPGMSATFELRAHQKNAAWRAIMDGNGLLAHEVGTGKTAVMVATAMEMKRMGKAAKPVIVVKNSTIEQIDREARQIYPNARILCVSQDDLSKENRALFMGKVANNDWDVIIITHSQMTKLSVGADFEARIIREELSRMRSYLDDVTAASPSRFTLKKIEAHIKRLETRLRKAAEAAEKDSGIDMNDLGVDALIVDEAHNFKNLEVQANDNAEVSGSINGSARAFDLYIKSRWLYQKRGGVSGLIFATGTPVSNHVMEIYNLMRYLQPDVMAKLGIAHPNEFAGAFLRPRTQWEPDVSGSGFKLRTRYTLVNLPELIRTLRCVMDVVRADDVSEIKRPDCERIQVSAEISETQAEQMEELVSRLHNIRAREVDPKDDNLLKIVSDGRKLALDPRLLDIDLPDNPDSKVQKCIENIMHIYYGTHEFRGTQLVFCDMASSSNGFSVYEDIKEKLVAAGIPPQEIEFVQSAKSDDARAELFAKVREGDVRILIGSTQIMGEGVNVQARLSAMHHLDAPWRPSDIEQRRGRMVRHGNQNEQTRENIYTTEGTFDLFMWTTLKVKNDTFNQILAGNVNARTFDLDIDPTYAETVAVATNNPLIKEKLEAEQDVLRLSSLVRAENKQRWRAEQSAGYNRMRLGEQRDAAEYWSGIVAKMGEPRTMDISGRDETLKGADDIAPVDAESGILKGGQEFLDLLTDSGRWRIDLTDAPETLEYARKKYKCPDNVSGAVLDGLTSHRVAAILNQYLKETRKKDCDNLWCHGISVAYHIDPKARNGFYWTADNTELGVRFDSMTHVERDLANAENILADIRRKISATEGAIARSEEEMRTPSRYADKLREAEKRLADIEAGLSRAAEVDAAPAEAIYAVR